MKVAMSTLALLVGFTATVSGVQAQDKVSSDKSVKCPQTQAPTSGYFPGGGWDGNNLRVSVSHSKLLKVSQ